MLFRKVEELTLYIVDQDEEIEKLKKGNTIFREQLDKMGKLEQEVLELQKLIRKD